jgi:hypothetical protein
LLKTAAAAAILVTDPPRQREASSAGVTFITSKIQELQTPELDARLALARSITAVIKKNYEVPAGPEILCVPYSSSKSIGIEE